MTQLFIDNAGRFIALVVLTCASGIISASETALFSLTRQQINRFRHAKSRSAAIIIVLRDNPTDLLSTVLLCNIFVNILLYSMLGVTAGRFAAHSALAATVFGVAGFLFVLFGAEIVPKLVAYSWGERLALLLAGPLRLMEIVTVPPRWILTRYFVDPLTRIFASHPTETVRTDDLQRLLNISQQQGLIDDRENVLLHQLMDLSTLRVSSVMTPRVDVVAFNLDQPRKALRALIRRHRLLRIPVYRDHVDRVVGIISAKALFLNPSKKLESLVQPVHFVPEQATCETLLRHFRQTHTQMALVVDEYGGLAGVVAMEDVVEAIVGELRAPEEKSDLPLLRRFDDRTYMADANLDVHEFCRAFELPDEQTRMHTLGGLVAQELDRLPATGDEVRIAHVRLTVVHMRHRRVMRVRVSLDEPIPDSPELNVLLAQSAQSARDSQAGGAP